jgi:Phosphotyrosine-binding domain
VNVVRSDNGVIPNSRLQSSTETRPAATAAAAAAGQHTYDLEHLATFSAIGNGPGQLLSAHNGISRVREMARTGAIWPLKVKIIISDRELAVIDFRTGEEMEHFPLALISEPTSAMAANRRSAISHEPLDNIVLFTVLEDPISKSSPPEMHVFQCISQSVSEYKYFARHGKCKI